MIAGATNLTINIYILNSLNWIVPLLLTSSNTIFIGNFHPIIKQITKAPRINK